MLMRTRTLCSKIRTRFFGKRVSVTMEELDLALALQLGWVEKFMGGYLLTDRGAEEIVYHANRAAKDQI